MITNSLSENLFSELLNSKKFIMLDFFDTVVHRKVHSEVVLYEWSKILSSKLNFLVSPSHLYRLRKNIEKNKSEFTNKEELSYDELLENIYYELGSINIPYNIKEFIIISENIEIDIELSYIYLDDNIKNLFLKHESQLKNKIILVSDFYMGKNFFKKALEELQILSYFDEIFVSSEVGLRKSTGNLFKHIVSTLSIDTSELVMIGDNKKSDYTNPAKIGIMSIHKKYIDVNKFYSYKNIKRSYYKLLYSSYEDNPFSPYIADIIYFMDRLYKEIKKENIDTVLFCSREGQFMKKIFDYHIEYLYSENSLRTEYFYVSRKSTYLAALKNLKEETFNRLLRQYDKIKIKDFLENLNFSDYEITNILNNLKIDANTVVNNITINDLKNNKYFSRMYEIKVSESKKEFLKYFKSFNLELNIKVAIVDIGWKGTIQDNLIDIIGNEYKLNNYYLGLISKEYGIENSSLKKGLVFDDRYDKKEIFNLLSRNRMFYERIFVANHASVHSYNLGVPILGSSDKDVIIYNISNKYQIMMFETYKKIIEIYKLSMFSPLENYDLLLENNFKKNILHYPKIFELEKKLRLSSFENFGYNNDKKYFNKLKLISTYLRKVDYFYVEYIYRFFYKLKLKFIGDFYSIIIYITKYTIFKMKIFMNRILK